MKGVPTSLTIGVTYEPLWFPDPVKSPRRHGGELRREVSALSHAENMSSSTSDQEVNYCLLPAYPEHGSSLVHTVHPHSSATPGQRYTYVKLDVSCDTGLIYNSTTKSIFCVNGEWSAPIHTCVRDLLGFCTLPTQDLKVEYRCLWFSGTLGWSRECESNVPSGNLVRPICRSPAYFSLRKLSEMQCRNGTWDYNPICKPACGLTTQHRQLEGTSSNHLELPWNVVIYGKSSESYIHICDGSLITATKIISSARCFHGNGDKLQPASNFKVAVNKMYYNYNDTRDINTQYSDVDDIILPSSYRGHATKYEDNIAIVVVKRPFFFHLSVQPVCLDFDNDLDSTQRADGNSGKTVDWSAVINNGKSSLVLNVIDLSYMKHEDCNTLLLANYRQYLTKDKFCARKKNGDGLTYDGIGLAFLESTTQRYYLRGVRSDYLMTVDDDDMYTFTSIMKHANFIKQHL